jgi:NitT/TauT family transport system permease protein
MLGKGVTLRNKSLGPIIALAALVAIWWAVVAVFALPEYLLPGPGLVAATFQADAASFMAHAGQTALEGLLGFAIALIAGFLGGIILFRFETLRRTFLPWTSALQAIPVVAIAPLLVVWFGSGLSAKVVMSAIISFFPILNAVLVGFAEVERDREALFRIYQTSYFKRLRHLLLPSSLPTLVMGIKISAGLAILGAIIAEMTGADHGLGFLILNASYRLETPTLFVAIFISGALGWTAYTLPDTLRWLLPRYWESARHQI